MNIEVRYKIRLIRLKKGITLRELERIVLLKVVDNKWMDHIDNMEELKNGIGLRAYGQKDPVVQYRIEGFDMFDQMISDIKLDVVKIMLHIQRKENARRQQTVTITGEGLQDAGIDGRVAPRQTSIVHDPIVNDGPKIGRNQPCPCRKPVRNIRTFVGEMHSACV